MAASNSQHWSPEQYQKNARYVSDGWLETFAQPYTSAVPAAERPGLVAEVVGALRPVLCDAHGAWSVDYVRLGFAASKPTAET